jgi:hypothetical protein
MSITENIQFNELEPLLSKQSDDFRAWYNENIHSKISDQTVPDSLDEYDRPFSFTLEADGFTVTTEWLQSHRYLQMKRSETGSLSLVE